MNQLEHHRGPSCTALEWTKYVGNRDRAVRGAALAAGYEIVSPTEKQVSAGGGMKKESALTFGRHRSFGCLSGYRFALLWMRHVPIPNMQVFKSSYGVQACIDSTRSTRESSRSVKEYKLGQNIYLILLFVSYFLFKFSLCGPSHFDTTF
jgi:hypothetical protein